MTRVRDVVETVLRLGDGTQVWRKSGSSSEAVVFIHGIGGSADYWEDQLTVVGEFKRALAWNMPGYCGSSLCRKADRTPDGYARALLAGLELMGVIEAHVVCHSVGALVGAALCKLSPLLVRSIAFVEPVLGGGGLSSRDRKRIFAERGARVIEMGMVEFARVRGVEVLGRSATSEIKARSVELMSRVNEFGYMAALEVMCDGNIDEYLPYINCPILLIFGQDDPIATPVIAKHLIARLGQAEYLELEGVGHYAAVEAAPEVNRALDKFWQEHGGAGAARRSGGVN